MCSKCSKIAKTVRPMKDMKVQKDESLNLTCRTCNKSMRVKVITKWQYTKMEKLRNGIVHSLQGVEYDVIESNPFRHENKRVIFPIHKTGFLFKKRCSGSNVKRVIEHTVRLYGQKELDRLDDHP